MRRWHGGKCLVVGRAEHRPADSARCDPAAATAGVGQTVSYRLVRPGSGRDELLDPVVVGVGDKEVAEGIGHHAARLVELAGGFAEDPPFAEEDATARRFLDPVVERVGDEA